MRLPTKPGKSTATLVLLLLFALYPPIRLALGPGDGGEGGREIAGGMERGELIRVLVFLTILGPVPGAAFLILPARSLWRRSPPRPLPDRAPWGLLDVTISALAGIALLIFIAALFPSLQGEEVTVSVILVSTACQGASVLFVLAWLRLASGTGPADLGLHPEGWAYAAFWSPILYLGCLPLYYVAGCFSLLLHLIITGAGPPHHPVAPFLIDPGTGRAAFAITIGVAVVAAPVLEEVLFRGFLYPALRNLSGPGPAILLSAGLFAVVHPIGHFYPLLLLGAVLAYAYERTGNLWGPILIHSCHNGAMLLLFLLLEGRIV